MKVILTIEEGKGTITIDGLESLCFELPDLIEDTAEEETAPIEYPAPIIEAPIEDTLPGVEELPVIDPIIDFPALEPVEEVLPVVEEVVEETPVIEAPPEVKPEEEKPAEEPQLAPEIMKELGLGGPKPEEAAKEEVLPVVEEEVITEKTLEDVAPVADEKEDLVVEVTKDNIPVLEDLVTMSDEVIEARDLEKKDALLAQLLELVEKLSK